MTQATTIDHEVAKRLTARDELALLSAAHARNPDSAEMRDRLALALIHDDQFDPAIALYARVAPTELGFAELLNLSHAHLAVERPADDEQAAMLSELAAARARSDSDRAAALATRGKALRRMGEVDAAEHCLRAALIDNPHNLDACKRLAAINLERQRPDLVLADMAWLDGRGAGHARLFAAQTLALAQAGDIAAARDQDGRDAFALSTMLAPPPGWDDLAAFNAALAAELIAHRGLRYERYGAASEFSWRIDAPGTGTAPRVRELLAALAALIERHLATLPVSDHSWLRARPAKGVLHSWCVITESTGFETWHCHQFGWMSGVYYVQVPSAITQGQDAGGCIAFGIPDDLAGDDAARAFGSTLIRPEPGMALLFPSHCYHRTFPHGAAERRICIAFDLWPG